MTATTAAAPVIATISAGWITIQADGTSALVASEARPANLADADTMLAWNGYGRTGSWDLAEAGNIAAPVQRVDNRFNGVTAARLWQRLGTTHSQNFLPVLASQVEPGWIITDHEESEVYLVAGQSVDGSIAKIHMVSEGKTWGDRHTGEFGRDSLVWVSKPKG
jgi:hypothetical protein